MRSAVTEAAARADVCQAVEKVYASLTTAIDERRPICVSSGKCCHFEEYGHRLYVTTMELAKFVADNPRKILTATPSFDSPRSLPVISATPWNGQGCPFQIDGLCGVHGIRPFGCRIFFCDSTSTDWQHEQYERHHACLRSLHDQLGVPYHYVEWRFALRVLQLAAE